MQWFWENEQAIRLKAEEASNHAELLEFEIVQIDDTAHVKFVFDTGDASGQNMTTACMWHASEWIFKELKKAEIELIQFGIEGNGASDKKVSQSSIEDGRGIRVLASVKPSDKAIRKFLRADAQEMYDAYVRSLKIAEHAGMIAFNINVVNAVASIFAATGQDLACVGESSTGCLSLTQLEGAIRFEVLMTNLVVGTVDGGTALPAQNAALRLMNCDGSGKVVRFASIIAGYALALELSTFAAVVGGRFTRAHQVFGRNKPKNWLVRSEFDERFVRPLLRQQVPDEILEIDFASQAKMDNGILTDLSSKVVKKMLGFVPMNVHTNEGDYAVLAKSKALDSEIMKGIHYMASQVDIGLADAILANSNELEYAGSHMKEIEVFAFLSKAGFKHMPKYYGAKVSKERELYVLLQELLVTHYNTELAPELWSKGDVKKVVNALVDFQVLSIADEAKATLPNVQSINEKALRELRLAMLEQCEMEAETVSIQDVDWLLSNVDSLIEVSLVNVLVHNDFNPRNIAIKKGGDVAIYDWELSVIGSPLHDLVEFLSFVITDDWSDDEILEVMAYHKSRLEDTAAMQFDQLLWNDGVKQSLIQFLVGRVTFCLLGESMLNYVFSCRVFKAGMRMIKLHT